MEDSSATEKVPGKTARKPTQKKRTQQSGTGTIDLEDSNLTKNVPRRTTRKSTQNQNTTVLEGSISIPQESSSKTTQKSKRQEIQQEDDETMSSFRQEDNVTMSSFQQECSNDIVSTSQVPVKESLEDSLSNDSESPDEYVLSDNSNSSIKVLTTRQMQSSQKSSRIQELFQKKSEEIRQKIGDNAVVEVNLQSKRPMQFQNMTNEFEIAYWLAYHKRILDLAISIRNGMMTSADEEYETTASSSSHTLSKVSFEPVSPPEIDQVIYIFHKNLTKLSY